MEWIKPTFYTHSFAVTSITALLEVHLFELGLDLDYTVSESDILFGVVLHSEQELSKTFWDGERGGYLHPVLLDEAISGI